MDQSKEIKKQIKEITQKLEQQPSDTDLLSQRAKLYEKLQDFGKALNDYNQVLRIEPGNMKAGAKAEMIKETLQYQNIDIYADTNLYKDPWEE
ncbi:MAG: hypothetical protein K9J27_10860 [Bacteroidales bacterium]|nr:hypothetical protein [Bacteroidales bacterium]MCF8334448.1 hypothetical protein [Bacteroidales bacterium]